MPISGEKEVTMRKVLIPKKDYVKELIKIIRVTKDEQKLRNLLSDYHEKDIAEAITFLTETERKHLYRVLGSERIAEIFSYFDDAEMYLEELSLEQAAKVISYMDADDALDVLDDLSESKKNEIVSHLDADAQKDVQKLLSYEEDEIGSCMTNNFVCISEELSVREAMSELVRQAGEHDNISTIYVTDEEEKFAGAIDLKDLIIARENTPLQEIISSSYPYVYEHENISECVEKIADYEEDSIPVLQEDGTIAGIITSQDIVEAVDDEMGEDYAKLAGLTAEEDLNEKLAESVKKRLPWLVILLFLGMVVSSVVGAFESVVAVIPIVMCFQSLILDMAGNVGTQSLAVTIRVLMDEELTAKQKLMLVVKEMKIGFVNGLFLGVMAWLFLGIYICVIKGYPIHHALLVSGCVGIALVTAMVISSMVGTLIPMFFKKINVDPAVASGPLITTVNDLVAIVVYYGLAMLFLVDLLHVTG